MNPEFGEVIKFCGMRYIYCGPCPIRPDILSIVLPVNDIGNPQKLLNASIFVQKEGASMPPS